MKQQKGFSLIELMITVAIIGIIAVIAVPSYQASVKKSIRKGEGMPALLILMQAQENYFTTRYTYTTSLAQINYNDPYVTDNGNYSIQASVCDPDTDLNACVLLTATGLDYQALDGQLTINSRGEKTYKGAAGWPR